jgi:hypothetical protein
MVRSAKQRHPRRTYTVTLQDPAGAGRMPAPLHAYHIVASSEAKARGLAVKKWAEDPVHKTYGEPPKHTLTIEGEAHMVDEAPVHRRR